MTSARRAGGARTPLSRGVRQAMDVGGFAFASDACKHWGVSLSTVRAWIACEEPAWLRTLRAIKRSSGLTWDELLDGRRRQ